MPMSFAISRSKHLSNHNDDHSTLPPPNAMPAVSSSPSCTTPPLPPLPPQARLNTCDLLISVLECHMLDLIRQNERKERVEALRRDAYCQPHPEPSVFHALQAPSITPVEYLRRLARYAFCSRSVFIAAFLHLHRVESVAGAHLRLNSLSVHRLVLTAVLLATKSIDDVLYDNAHFAKVGGLDVKELNMLELDMLKVLDFRLHISPEEFEQFEIQLLESALTTDDPDFSMLPTRLRNLGYRQRRVTQSSNGKTSSVNTPSSPMKIAPASPTSSMVVSFVSE